MQAQAAAGGACALQLLHAIAFPRISRARARCVSGSFSRAFECMCALDVQDDSRLDVFMIYIDLHHADVFMIHTTSLCASFHSASLSTVPLCSCLLQSIDLN